MAPPIWRSCATRIGASEASMAAMMLAPWDSPIPRVNIVTDSASGW